MIKCKGKKSRRGKGIKRENGGEGRVLKEVADIFIGK